MKSEVGKPFLEGGPHCHTDATDRENPGYLGNPYFGLIENRLTKKIIKITTTTTTTTIIIIIIIVDSLRF